MPKSFNIRSQKNIRRILRKKETGAEKILWFKLRNKQLFGYKFRRQHGIGKYIVDFYCPEKRLVVEIDGVTHYSDTQIEYDKQRQAEIEKLGIRFIRVTNTDVYTNVDGVLHLIAEKLLAIQTSYYEDEK